MSELTLFNQNLVNKRIPLETLVEHVLLRSEQTGAHLNDFSLQTVQAWFLEISWDQYYKNQEPFLTEDGVSEIACNTITNTINNESLRRLVQIDIVSLFGSVGHTLQMVHSSGTTPTQLEGSGVFSEIKFLPPGADKEFYFPNGAKAISSTYLHAVSKELGMTRDHKDILKKIRKYFNELEPGEIFPPALEHSYYDLAEGEYKDLNNQSRVHLWMSSDLCLAIAGTEHVMIQRRIIDDLNRLHNVVQMLSSTVLPQPSLQAYLPGTVENQYREKGLVEIESGRALGYYPMAQVKQMFCDQNNVSGSDFDVKYPWKYIYTELYTLTELHQERTIDTVSHTGKGVTKLFALSVLKEYFDDIDFSNLI